MKDDSTRYFAAIKEIKSKKEQKGIVVKDVTGKTAVTENEQIEIITSYLKQMLAPDTSQHNIIQYMSKK